MIVFDKANVPVYFNMNTICSAGTGEFLKQIADEAGISLNQFGPIALEAMQSARIDSTCTVFSRRDFRHLTQKGVPLAERLAGICDAMVTNYLKNVVKDVPLPSPIVFQGGVAFNQGVKRAFEHHLGVEVIIPPYHDIVGALGMAAIVLEEKKILLIKLLLKRTSLFEILIAKFVIAMVVKMLVNCLNLLKKVRKGSIF